MSVIEGKSEEPSEEHDINSHFKPICAAIYNDLFDQVIIITYITIQFVVSRSSFVFTSHMAVSPKPSKRESIEGVEQS